MTTMQMFTLYKLNILPITEEMALLIIIVITGRKNCNTKAYQMVVNGELLETLNASPTMLAGKAIYHNVVKQERGLKIVMEVMIFFATEYVLQVGILMDFQVRHNVTCHVQILVIHSTIPRPKDVDKQPHL